MEVKKQECILYLNCLLRKKRKEKKKENSNAVTNASDVRRAHLAVGSLPVSAVPLLSSSGKMLCCSHMFAFFGSLNTRLILNSYGYMGR